MVNDPRSIPLGGADEAKATAGIAVDRLREVVEHRFFFVASIFH